MSTWFMNDPYNIFFFHFSVIVMDPLKRQPHPHHLQDQVQQKTQNLAVVIPTTVTAVSNPIVVVTMAMVAIILNPILIQTLELWQN